MACASTISQIRRSCSTIPSGRFTSIFTIHLAVIRPRGFLCMVKTLVNLSLGMVLQDYLICEIVLAHTI